MTPEQQALLDKAQRSLQASQQLMQQEFYDFAVSRAYYAMFYVAEALLNYEGLAFSSHSAVIGAFGQHFAKTGKVPAELHRYLIDAQA
ncbi:MAG TPA: HEPN domain-containing protein [Trichocoleus sp.]